jgi:phage baseplate assembly protein W
MAIEEFLGKDIAHQRDFILTPSGDLETSIGLQNLKEALYRRLLTTPGSLIHRPDYGVGIKNWQNGLNSIARQRELANRISSQFQEDPRIESVSAVEVLPNDNPSLLQLKVKVKVRGYGESQLTFIPFEEA